MAIYAIVSLGLAVPIYAQEIWVPTDTMDHPPHTTEAAVISGGRVLVTGGFSGSESTSIVQVYNPKKGLWSIVAPMSMSRTSHSMTRLANGRILVAGGFDQADCPGTCTTTVTATAELYNPATNSWSATGSMSAPRAQHTAVLLKNGRVLVAGGFSDTDVVATAEIYDPATGQWQAASGMTTARSSHGAVRIANGRVLVMGGYDVVGAPLATSELYHPKTGLWSATGSLMTPRAFVRQAAVLLQSGGVLVAGGIPLAAPVLFPALDSAERYDPATGMWTDAGTMSHKRDGHTLTRLADGRVLAAGGWEDGSGAAALASADLYDPATNTWTPTGPLNVPRIFHFAALLKSGDVLAGGGFQSGQLVATAELFKP